MTHIAVIGIGSPHGVDQVGWQAIEFLQKDHTFQSLLGNAVRLLALDRPGMGLLEYLAGVDYAILIDAVEGGAAGSIMEIKMEQLLKNTVEISSHHAGVAEALAMGDTLNALPQKITVLGIATGENATPHSSDRHSFKQLALLVFDHVRSYVDPQ
ncbi:hydrogenase maturation protease [Kaarinaea lacus]